MSEQQIYVFNQYYIDLLKKIKGFAKDKKENSKSARDILRSIKKNYSSMDKLSNEYVEFLNSSEFFKKYQSLENKSEFTEEFVKECIYKDITIQQIVDVIGNNFLLTHFLCLMNIFMIQDLPVDKVLDVIRNLNNSEVFEEKIKLIESEEVVEKLRYLTTNHKEHTRNALHDELKDIESTSLGKLAKEIMQDINIEDLQKSIADPNTDILSSLQNPDSGFGKVFSTVGQKMLSKISNGELQQEKLLEDAMQLATKIPGLIPGGLGPQLGNLGSMLQQFQSMMGQGGEGSGMNPMDLMKNLGLNMNGPQRNAANSRMSHAMKKQKAADRLKKKLQKHRENNIQREVEEDNE